MQTHLSQCGMGEALIFANLRGGEGEAASMRITSQRSTMTAAEVAPTQIMKAQRASEYHETASHGDFSVAAASPGPCFSSPTPTLSRRVADATAATMRITSERAATATAALPSLPPPRSRHRERSVSVSSASDLSEVPSRRHRHHRRRSQHHKRSSRRTEVAVPPAVTRSSHRSRRERSVSSSSSSASSEPRRRHRRHHRRHRSRTPPSSSRREEAADECGRCSKPRYQDPLDPAIAGLNVKKKERIRKELVERIVKLRRKYPEEGITLPRRGISDSVVCYRRYRRVARHLYAKNSMSYYRLMVYGFTFLVQIVMTIMFKSAAGDYLKREFESIAKYDSVLYELGARSYTPYTAPASPGYRFALQLITPIVLIIITFVITKFTSIPASIVNMGLDKMASYMQGPESTDYRTLLDDEDADEDDESSSDDEDTTPPTNTSARRGGTATPTERRATVHIPDLEAEIPAENVISGHLHRVVPSLVNMITSNRPGEPSGGANALGLMQTLLSMCSNPAPIGKPQPTAVPAPASRVAPAVVPPPAVAEPVIYDS